MSVKFGLSNVHYAKYDSSTETFATPVAWPGARAISIEYEGDTNIFYADNVAYYTSITSSSITGSYEVADTPDSVLIDLLGYIKDDTTGMLIEDMEANPESFAFLFEIDGDPQKRRICLPSCKLSRPSTEANTKEDTTEPDTDNLDFTAIGMSMTVLGKTRVVSKYVVKQDGAVYDDFFTSVQLPTAAGA